MSPANACLLPRPSAPLRARLVFRFVLAACLALAVVPLAMPNLAYAAEDEAEGRRLFKRGQELFIEGRYLEAAQAFETGYAAAPRTAFLINIAHSYRRAGELEKAKTYYLKLLELEPETPQRAEVEANVKSIDDALMLKNIPPPPPKPAVPDADEAFRRQVAEESAEASPKSPSGKSSGEGGSVFGKTWFWLVLTAAAGAAVAVVVVAR